MTDPLSFPILLGFLCAAGATMLVRHLAITRNLMDHPNARSSHTMPSHTLAASPSSSARLPARPLPRARPILARRSCSARRWCSSSWDWLMTSGRWSRQGNT